MEAVKLQNVRALRERVFVPMRRAVLPVPIVLVDGEQRVLRRTDRFGRWFLSSFLGWLAFHALLAALPLVLVDVMLDTAGVDPVGSAFDRYAEFFGSTSLWLQIVLGLATIWAGLAFVATVGEAVHQALIRMLVIPIRVLTFVEAKTPDGTVGIIGAGLLVLGFSLQIVGAVASSTDK